MTYVDLSPYFPAIPASEVIVPQGNCKLPYTAVLPSGVPATITYSNYPKMRKRRLYKSVVKAKELDNAVASSVVPTFTSATPSSGDSGEATDLVGTNFAVGIAVSLISSTGVESACTGVTRSSATAVSCNLPTVANGTYSLKLANPAGFIIVPGAISIVNV